MIPPDPHIGGDVRGSTLTSGGRPPPVPNTQPGQHPARPLAGRKRSGVGTQTLVPVNFSVVVAPLIAALRPYIACLGTSRISVEDLHTLARRPTCLSPVPAVSAAERLIQLQM